MDTSKHAQHKISELVNDNFDADFDADGVGDATE